MSDFCPVVEASPNPYTQIPTLVCQNGLSFVNLAKYSQKIYWLGMQRAGGTASVALAALGAGTGSLTPPADQGGMGDCELHKLYGSSTGQFAVQLYLQQQDRLLMKNPVESTLVLGYPELPSRLLQPIFLPSTNSLVANLTDLSNGSNTVVITAEGMQIVDPMGTLGVTAQQLQQYYYRSSHPYWASFDSGPQVTAPGSAASPPYVDAFITIPSNADLNGFWLVGRTAGDPSNLTIEIYEGQRRLLMNTALRGDQCASWTRAVTGMPGNLIPAASLPPIWQFTHLFQRATQLRIRITSTEATARLVSLAIAGQLVYDKPSTPGMAVRYPEAYAQQVQGTAAMAGLAGLRGW
jgi:hypothetical protein